MIKYFFTIMFSFVLFNITFSEDTIIWNKNTRLTYADFSAKAIDSKFKAISSLGNISLITDSSIILKTYFIKSKSWMKIKNKELLNHEQKHFDLYELQIRRLRKELSFNIFTNDSLQSDITRIFLLNYNTGDLENILYDIETNYSQDEYCQEWWNKYIDEQLKALEAYSNPIIKLRIEEE